LVHGQARDHGGRRKQLTRLQMIDPDLRHLFKLKVVC
jgi:hypothetical protein